MASLMLQDYINTFNQSRDASQPLTTRDGLEISYFTLTAWIRFYYPELTLEWVKKNISEDLFTPLVEKANEIFFPRLEKGTPEKNPKRKRNRS